MKNEFPYLQKTLEMRTLVQSRVLDFQIET